MAGLRPLILVIIIWLLHIGDGDSKHSINIGGYQAFEGAQIFIGSRNISFNHGRSNDVILMAEKSNSTAAIS
ncbi:Uncharacterised protein [Moellerella wisconsensis]|nr:Uncharacterised protein [Moellerella wisconsensis]